MFPQSSHNIIQLRLAREIKVFLHHKLPVHGVVLQDILASAEVISLPNVGQEDGIGGCGHGVGDGGSVGSGARESFGA